MYILAFTVGALVTVRLLVMGLRRFVVKGPGFVPIAIANALAFVIATILGGFGMADGGAPKFGTAFVSYLPAVALSIIWDIVALSKTKRQKEISN